MAKENNAKEFFLLGKGTYIRCENVKYILDSESKAAGQMLDKARATGTRIVNLVGQKDKRLTVVTTFDGTLYLSGFKPSTIADRLEKAGVKTIRVDTGTYLPRINILEVYSFDGTVATKLRKTCDPDSNVSLVRRTRKRKTTLRLKNGELVSVVCTPSKVAESED